MQEPVEDGSGQDGVVEGFTPIEEALVGGDDQAGALVAAHHQAEEQAGFQGGEGQIADLIHDQHLGVNELLQGAFKPVFVEGFDQTHHQVFQGQEEDRVARLHGFDAQGDGEVGFSLSIVLPSWGIRFGLLYL